MDPARPHERPRPADFVADDLLCALDPAYWAREVVGISLEPWQEAVLVSQHRRICLLCCRQAGKSTVTALKAAHLALYRRGSKVLIVSRAQRQSELIFSTVERFIWLTERGESRVEDNKKSIVLKNGSSVVCVPGSPDTIRGFSSIDLLVEDEAAFIADPVNDVITPMIDRSGGQMMLLSSPNGQQGHFFHAATGSGDWERYLVTWEQCAWITPEKIQEYRDDPSKGDNWVRQEYGCEFLSAVDAVFSAEQINAAIDADVEVLDI